ncbi:hypothetical protein [uncultured Ruminococcus sp.]|uniref:hypothetical protein n=1 Tax=uncultured Ruminococcus sp. TaxID=165186 RepID=UPI0025F124EF|nr:hypothetical protein [uncultured Ruminococcus sp.]
MKKLLVLALCICQVFAFTACGSEENTDSSQSTAESSENQQIETPTNDIQVNSVTIRMDSTNLHEGVEFNDSELLAKTSEFYKSVMENGNVIQPDSRESVAGGDWLIIDIPDAPQISFESGESDIVRIGTDYYSVPDEETEYKQYVISFLEAGGYWGDSAMADDISDSSNDESAFDSITVYMDSTNLGYGVEFTDSEILDRTAEFCKYIEENAQKAEPNSQKADKGGDWLKIELSNGSVIYFESSVSDYVRFNKEYYHIEDNYKQDVIDYLSRNGYRE